MPRSVNTVNMWLFGGAGVVLAAAMAAHEIRPSDDGGHRLGTWVIALGACTRTLRIAGVVPTEVSTRGLTAFGQHLVRCVSLQRIPLPHRTKRTMAGACFSLPHA